MIECGKNRSETHLLLGPVELPLVIVVSSIPDEVKDSKEGLWGKRNPDIVITEDQVKIEENSTIQTTRALIAEVEKIGDMGETADPLEVSYDSADIFLKHALKRK